jgi:lysozyme
VKLSDRGAQLIAEFEGFRSCPYWDTNHWSIGHGTRSAKGARCIDREEARRRLRQQADAVYGAAVNNIGVKLNQNQFDALTSLAYNVGPGVVGDFSPVGRALRARDWRKAADAMLAYNQAGGQVLAGLTNRRRKERELFLRPPPPPPVRYTKDERKWLTRVKRPGPHPVAEQWLKEQARDIMRKARAEPGGWKKYDRGRRYQGIRRALREHS